MSLKRLLHTASPLATTAAAAFFAALLLTSTVAFGEEPKKEAAARFDRGIRLFDEGDFSVALAEFKRAYAIAPHPLVLYNMALAYAALGKTVEATDTCDALLKAPGSLNGEQLERVKTMREEQASRVAELTITTSAPAHVEIDNIEVGVTPLATPIRVASGVHIVGAFATGFGPMRKQVTVAGKTKEDVAFTLAPLEGRLAHLAVSTHLPGAELYAEGDLVATTPLAAPITLAPGKFHVELRRKGYVTKGTDIVLGDGANGSVTLELEEDPARPADVNGTIELHASEPGATMLVDGTLRGAAAHLVIPGGPHRLRVERGGFFAYERDIVLEENHTTVIDAHLQPTAETRAAYESSTKTRRTIGWIALGAGSAIVIGGVVYFIINTSAVNSAQSDYDSIVADSVRGSGKRCDPAGAGLHDVCTAQFDVASSTLNDAKTRNVIALIGAGVGAAAAVTGAIILLTNDDPHRYDKTVSSVSPRLTPVGSPLPGGGFVGVAGTF